MYTLTIVLLVSQVVVTADFNSLAACEQAAARVLRFDAGPQAVGSALCTEKQPSLPRPQ